MMNCKKDPHHLIVQVHGRPPPSLAAMSLVEMIKRHGPPAIEKLMLLCF